MTEEVPLVVGSIVNVDDGSVLVTVCGRTVLVQTIRSSDALDWRERRAGGGRAFIKLLLRGEVAMLRAALSCA